MIPLYNYQIILRESSKLFPKYLEELKIENKYTLNKVTNDPNVKALKRFKKILKLNLEENVVNGKIVDKPDEKFKEEYSIITKILHHGKKEVKFTDDMQKDLYSIRTVPTVQKDKIISKDKEKKFFCTKVTNFKNFSAKDSGTS